MKTRIWENDAEKLLEIYAYYVENMSKMSILQRTVFNTMNIWDIGW